MDVARALLQPGCPIETGGPAGGGPAPGRGAYRRSRTVLRGVEGETTADFRPVAFTLPTCSADETTGEQVVPTVDEWVKELDEVDAEGSGSPNSSPDGPAATYGRC